MRAALAAAYPRFFQAGAEGLRSALAVSRSIALPGIGYAVVVAGVLLIGAPVIPLVLGADFAPSVGAVQLLAALPVLRWIHYLAADSLTGAGRQGARTACPGRRRHDQRRSELVVDPRLLLDRRRAFDPDL